MLMVSRLSSFALGKNVSCGVEDEEGRASDKEQEIQGAR